MNHNDLLLWRENHKLSQAQLADLLHWSRDQLARRELGTVSLPEDLPTTLELLGKTLAAAASPEIALPKHVKGSKKRYLDLTGIRIKPEVTRAFKKGHYVWEYGWFHEEDQCHYMHLMVMDYDAFRRLALLCTPISLNVNTWTVGAFLMKDNPFVQQAIPILQAKLDANRANLPELSTVLMSNEEVFRPIGDITSPVHHRKLDPNAKP